MIAFIFSGFLAVLPLSELSGESKPKFSANGTRLTSDIQGPPKKGLHQNAAAKRDNTHKDILMIISQCEGVRMPAPKPPLSGYTVIGGGSGDGGSSSAGTQSMDTKLPQGDCHSPKIEKKKRPKKYKKSLFQERRKDKPGIPTAGTFASKVASVQRQLILGKDVFDIDQATG